MHLSGSVVRRCITCVLIVMASLLTLIGSSATDWQESEEMSLETQYYVDYGHSAYHFYTSGVDWEEPVGLLYYFGGDYFRSSEAEVLHPNSAVMRDLAEQAADRNLLLVVPLIPSERGPNGYTWWQDGADNAEWFLDLHQHLNTQIEPEEDLIWFMGYSGGAEFISHHLLADYHKSFGTGGALLVGGGGPPAALDPKSRELLEPMTLKWVVGENDVAGSTNPPDWSALNSAREGEAFYHHRGVSDTTIDVLENTDHLDYDLAVLLGEYFEDIGLPSKLHSGTITAIGWSLLGVAVAAGIGTLYIWRKNRRIWDR